MDLRRPVMGGAAEKSNTRQIQIFQNETLRLITNAPFPPPPNVSNTN